MSELMIEAIALVSELNDLITDDPMAAFSVYTDGYEGCINWGSTQLWSSANDDRQWDEDDEANTQQPLKDYVLQEFKKLTALQSELIAAIEYEEQA